MYKKAMKTNKPYRENSNLIKEDWKGIIFNATPSLQSELYKDWLKVGRKIGKKVKRIYKHD